MKRKTATSHDGVGVGVRMAVLGMAVLGSARSAPRSAPLGSTRLAAHCIRGPFADRRPMGARPRRSTITVMAQRVQRTLERCRASVYQYPPAPPSNASVININQLLALLNQLWFAPPSL